jgi:hypothetical protein
MKKMQYHGKKNKDDGTFFINGKLVNLSSIKKLVKKINVNNMELEKELIEWKNVKIGDKIYL